jgi:hypothetical protein
MRIGQFWPNTCRSNVTPLSVVDLNGHMEAWRQPQTIGPRLELVGPTAVAGALALGAGAVRAALPSTDSRLAEPLGVPSSMAGNDTVEVSSAVALPVALSMLDSRQRLRASRGQAGR